jgi:hypothetical protein
MTREESWQVESVALTLLRHVTSLGYTVSVFRFPSSVLGTRPACVEMQSKDYEKLPLLQHAIVRQAREINVQLTFVLPVAC